MYRVELLPAAARQLAKLERRVQQRMARAINGLATDPRGANATKLRGAADVWRIRVGDYRVLYEIHDRQLVVLVIAVGHRASVYRANVTS
jgi:mRNA interferase RelE/StbE